VHALGSEASPLGLLAGSLLQYGLSSAAAAEALAAVAATAAAFEHGGRLHTVHARHVDASPRRAATAAASSSRQGAPDVGYQANPAEVATCPSPDKTSGDRSSKAQPQKVDEVVDNRASVIVIAGLRVQ
jgi:hypothetical protein